jgi:hypothetical protein
MGGRPVGAAGPVKAAGDMGPEVAASCNAEAGGGQGGGGSPGWGGGPILLPCTGPGLVGMAASCWEGLVSGSVRRWEVVSL